jgi:hypothetical protein
MGFHVSWLTALGKAPDVVRAELGLTETGEREYVPESDVTGVLLPSGWYVVFFNEPLPAEFDEVTLLKLSQGTAVMVFVVEEASMVSLARGYANGARTWEVVHDANEGMEHTEATGAPPPQMIELRDRLLAELSKSKRSADYLFDLPAAFCKATTGFRHDEDIEGIDGDAFTVLERSSRG